MSFWKDFVGLRGEIFDSLRGFGMILKERRGTMFDHAERSSTRRSRLLIEGLDTPRRRKAESHSGATKASIVSPLGRDSVFEGLSHATQEGA